MWRKIQNSNNIKPLEIDDKSSSVVVYVRKDFKEVETEEGNTVWEYMENEVLKEDWEMYKQIISNTSDLSDIQDALIELAEMVVM